jgi:hypothetical protein
MRHSRVISSKIEQDMNELRVRFRLTDQQSCLVKYDLSDQSKSYFIESVGS